jgi:two-component system, sporulation sensor kinase E
MKDKDIRGNANTDTTNNESMYRALFEQATDGILIIDFEGNVLDVNASMCNIFGYLRDELLQMNFSSFIEPDHLKSRPLNFKSIFSGKHGFSDRKMLHRNGEIIYAEINAKKFDDTKIIIIIHDISERVKNHNIVLKSEENIKSIIENTNISYILIDKNLNIVAFNNLSQKKSKLFLQKEFKAGDYFLDTIPKERKDFVLQNLQEVVKGNPSEYDSEYKLPDGSQMHIKINKWPIRDTNNEVIGICISSTDITQRKIAELEKEKVSHQLNERVKELTTLYQVGHIFEQEDKSIEKLLQEIVDILPLGWQYPEVTAARIIVGDVEVKTVNFRTSPYTQTASFFIANTKTGVIEIVYLKEMPSEEEGPFLQEERKMINMLADILRINISRRRETEALKKSEANLQTIFKTTETAYTLFDKNLRVISFNQQSSNLAKKEFAKKMTLNASFFDFVREENKDKIAGLAQKVLDKGKTLGFETSFDQENGSFNWYEIKLIPVNDSHKTILGLMITINNINERKQFDKQTRKQLELLKDLSFITSHELRHEYTKLHSIVHLLNNDDKLNAEEQHLVMEGLKSFGKINSIIYKINDKITFGQVSDYEHLTYKKNAIEKVLLVDDDMITNFLHSRVLQKHFEKEKINEANSVDKAIAYLKEHDKSGNHLIFLDLNMGHKSGWDFLQEYEEFKVQSPVIILSSSIDPADKEKAKQFEIVKNFVSKPLRFEVIEKLKQQGLIKASTSQ